MICRIFFQVTCIAATLAVLAAKDSATARDCQDGTVEVSWGDFFSTQYAGRLAIATDATTPAEAKDADSYCVLNISLFKATAKIRKRYDRIYFVFNNRPVVSPENAETSFLGLQVRAKSGTGESSVIMRREGDSWVDRPLDRSYPERQFVKSGPDVIAVARAHSKTLLASRGSEPALADLIPQEDAFAAKVGASVHGEVKPRDGVENKKTWDYRDRMTFVGGQLNNGEPPNNVTAIWLSFAQRPTGGFLRPPKRVVTGVRVGNASEIDVEMFGSNPEIPEYRYIVQFSQ